MTIKLRFTVFDRTFFNYTQSAHDVYYLIVDVCTAYRIPHFVAQSVYYKLYGDNVDEIDVPDNQYVPSTSVLSSSVMLLNTLGVHMQQIDCDQHDDNSYEDPFN